MVILNEMLNKYKGYLTILKYPEIRENNIRNIFNKENKLNLLIWMLIKLIPEYKIRIDEAKQNNTLTDTIADMLQLNGFCFPSEKNFVVEDIQVDTAKQIKIFDRIFHMLLLLADEEDEENIPTEVYEEYIYTKLENKIELNIDGYTPDLHSTASCHPEDYAAEIKKLKKEIEEAELERDELQNFIESRGCIESYSKEEFEKLTSELEITLSKYSENPFKFSEKECLAVDEDAIEKREKLTSHLKDICTQLSHLVKILEMYPKLREMIKDELPKMDKMDSENALSLFIKNNYTTAETIAKQLKTDDDAYTINRKLKTDDIDCTTKLLQADNTFTTTKN